MIVVFAEHFLNQEGQRYFPDWVDEVAATLSDFDGFISIRRLTDPDHPMRSLLLLYFESRTLLRKWSKSSTHDHLIEKLTPYRRRKQISQIFRLTDETRAE